MFESDDDDFGLSPSSKLSAIFNTPTISDNSNAALTYQAPKQPKPLDSTLKTTEPRPNSESGTQPQSSVILAKVITLWKLDNGRNISVGKHMVAIIKNPANDICEMIIYQEKTNIIIREALGKSLIFHQYPNNFLALYDNQKQLWNLNFDTPENLNGFLQCAIKYNCVITDRTNLKADRDNAANNNTFLATDSAITSKPDIVPSKTHKEPSSKQKILSRITKMGQPILPRAVEQNRSSELSDSETESSDTRPSKPVTVPRKFKRNVNHEKALAPMVPESNNTNFNPYIPANNNFMMPNTQMHHNGIMYSPQPITDYGMTNFVIAQNAELKANLAEINLKLNNALSYSDNNGNNREDVSALKSKIKCQNLKIDNLSAELERTKKACEVLRNKCDKFDEKKELSESNELEINLLKSKLERLETIQNELEEAKTNLQQKDKVIEIQTLKLKDLENYYNTNAPIKESLTKENNELKLKLELITLKANEYEEEIKQKENELSLVQDKSLVLDKDQINKVVKESMNEAFRSIMENFDENESYEFKDIQGALLENLKKTTYRLMNSFL